MKTLERIKRFAPDYLLKTGHNHYMVKGNERVYIHKRTFDIARESSPETKVVKK